MQPSLLNRLVAFAVVIQLACSFPALAQKPSLVAELEAAIESGGAEGVRQRFDAIWPEQKDQYAVDLQALTKMVSEKAQNAGGDYKLLDVLSQITGTIAEAQMQASMQTMQRAEPADADTSNAAVETSASTPEAEPAKRDDGEARQDLQRFSGLYGTPDSPRKLFVSQTCGGYLMVGAMWGNVAPFQMVSISENVFDNNNEHFNLQVTFETDGNGQATELRHTLNALPSPAERSGDLPADWDNCVDRSER